MVFLLTLCFFMILQVLSSPMKRDVGHAAVPVDSGDAAAPEMLAGKFEGDINMPSDFNPRHRNAIINKGQLWPNGVVYYKISSSYSSSVKSTIKSAMQDITDRTRVGSQSCIKFVERTSQPGYIHIQPLSGCYSSVGRTGYGQELSLGRGCERKGTMMHEMLHALGFFHEQSRADRDNYVTVHWDNIQSGTSRNFDKYALGTQIDHLSQPYDYGSIMHYSRMSFSKDGRSPTMTPKQGGVTIGQRVALSDIDVRMIQLLYGCSVNPVKPTEKPPTTTGTGTGTGTGTTSSGTCCDKIDNCVAYTKSVCTGSYASWAQENCQQFCGFCTCKDKLATCSQFDKASACYGEYEPWAKENCARFCGHCDSCNGGSTQTTSTTECTCKDKLDNCVAYGTSSCGGDYAPWARENCPKTCGYCSSCGGAVVKCEDKLKNCAAYGKSACSGSYEPWARDKCALTCGYCTATKCEDKLSNCAAYGSSSCVGSFEPWARDSCALTCGYCSGPTTKAVIATTAKPTECKDKLSNCYAYGKSTCVGDYEPWARDKCPAFCGFCSGATTSPTVTECRDKLDNCAAYGKGNCGGAYEPWARDKCALFCEYCSSGTNTGTATGKLTCADIRDDCHAFGKSACYGDYEPWARQNCKVYCGYCGSGQVVVQTTPSTSVQTACLDKLPNCADYGTSSCVGDFEPWAKDKCPQTCGYCSGELFAADTCNFESGLCNWRNSRQDNIDWIRRRRNTPTYGTGPNTDYSGSGYFAYVEATGNYNKVAKLISPKSYPGGASVCVQFAYHMYGKNMGTLSVSIQGNGFYESILQIKGDQGNNWKIYNVNLSVPDRSFEVVFEAKLGGGPQSDIAIDDIGVKSGKC